jgi:surfeit locus 1 family protein
MRGFRPRLWPTLVTLPALAVLIGLGTWQVQRLQWKTELIAQREAALAAPPVALPDDPAGFAALAFRRVEAAGRFLHERELHLQPRVLHGQVGAHVLTPLQLDDGRILLVNRGWVPEAARDPARRPEGQVAGPQTVTGVLRAGFAPGWFTPENQPAANQWFWIDIPAMARIVGEPLLPAVLDADARPVPGGLPVGGQTPTEIRNDHLQYAVTWYALAVALLVIYVLFHRQPR